MQQYHQGIEDCRTWEVHIGWSSWFHGEDIPSDLYEDRELCKISGWLLCFEDPRLNGDKTHAKLHSYDGRTKGQGVLP